MDFCSSTVIEMDGHDRLSVTVLDTTSTVETRPSLTLEAVLRADTQPLPSPASSPPLHPVETPARTRRIGRDEAAWKSLRGKLRLKRTAAVWTPPNPVPTSDTPIPSEDNLIPDNDNRFNRLGYLLSNSQGQSSNSRSDQTNNHRSNADVSEGGGRVRERRLRLGTALAEERAVSAPDSDGLAEAEVQTEVQGPRMSLMELLEESTVGIYDSIEPEPEPEPVDEEEESCGGGGAVAATAGCCVCMVRRKGAAFIPCGHSFCRLCSRQLWVLRGTCPLCNSSISEILHIF